ncbi:HAD family hydrolase [Alkalihalophilus lindianensis]|uniref:HAD family hydrolase n=1 Tax=Alkalihalophilus lindianensis TaxID=1630542 RepID=A0ABU3X5L6_9BACI|nr:HAD family hydrolase [Alkalihalophilus lindianensis]MDV2682907.1 HAD family hydrolase [Alkalihalophilus lindianensis]
MIKGVLFDLDGTLLDRDSSVKKFIHDQYDRLHLHVGHIPKDEYVARFIELDQRGYVWKDKVYQQLIKEYGITGMKWEELLEDYLNDFKFHCVPFPNLTEMLEQLKNHNLTLGMITNGRGQFQLDNIKALGIEPYFDRIFISEWEGMKKPDPTLFRHALNTLNVQANESVFVGDHPGNDVRAARDVGMRVIWKEDRFWSHADADATVNDLSEIPLLIKELILAQ